MSETAVWGASRLLFSRVEAAELLNISTRSLDYLAANNRIGSTRLGRRRMFRRDDLLNFAGTGIRDRMYR